MKDQNKLDWKKYEFITKYIYETLGQEYNINVEGYGQDCKIRGHSGVQHQIDVLTSETDGERVYRTTIECKYWNKKVNKDIVMKLLGIMKDTDIERGIIVSKSGYTPDAQQFAKHNNVLIVELREAGSKDKEIKKELQIADILINLKINTKRAEITNIVADSIDGSPIFLHEKDQYRTIIEYKCGRKTRLFDAIMTFRKYVDPQPAFKTVTKKYDCHNSVIHTWGSHQKINSITYTGLLTVRDSDHSRVFSIVDKVWLVMEKIFEQQTFIISENGIIIQNISNDS